MFSVRKAGSPRCNAGHEVFPRGKTDPTHQSSLCAPFSALRKCICTIRFPRFRMAFSNLRHGWRCLITMFMNWLLSLLVMAVRKPSPPPLARQKCPPERLRPRLAKVSSCSARRRSRPHDQVSRTGCPVFCCVSLGAKRLSP